MHRLSESWTVQCLDCFTGCELVSGLAVLGARVAFVSATLEGVKAEIMLSLGRARQGGASSSVNLRAPLKTTALCQGFVSDFMFVWGV